MPLPTATALDGMSVHSSMPRACLQAPNCIYVWVGAHCPQPFVAAAETTARLLPKYEATSSSRVAVFHQGEE